MFITYYYECPPRPPAGCSRLIESRRGGLIFYGHLTVVLNCRLTFLGHVGSCRFSEYMTVFLNCHFDILETRDCGFELQVDILGTRDCGFELQFDILGTRDCGFKLQLDILGTRDCGFELPF